MTGIAMWEIEEGIREAKARIGESEDEVVVETAEVVTTNLAVASAKKRIEVEVVIEGGLSQDRNRVIEKHDISNFS